MRASQNDGAPCSSRLYLSSLGAGGDIGVSLWPIFHPKVRAPTYIAPMGKSAQEVPLIAPLALVDGWGVGGAISVS